MLAPHNSSLLAALRSASSTLDAQPASEGEPGQTPLLALLPSPSKRRHDLPSKLDDSRPEAVPIEPASSLESSRPRPSKARPTAAARSHAKRTEVLTRWAQQHNLFPVALSSRVFTADLYSLAHVHHRRGSQL